MTLSRRRLAVIALALCSAFIRDAGAQASGIVVAAGSATSAVAPPGTRLTVPIIVDMTNAIEQNFASLALTLTWGAGRLTLDSIRSGTFGSLTTNASASGATLALFNPSGTLSTQTVANLYFTAGSTVGGTHLSVAPTAIADGFGFSLMNQVHGRDLDVCVAPLGNWGDVNGDGDVNIIDAQQIARYSVDLSVANPAAVTRQGNVNADLSVDITDAQQIARYAVGLSAAARLGTTVPVVPALAGVTVTPAEPSVGVGATLQLVATPKDANANSLAGCVDVAWSSNVVGQATVSGAGVVTGVGAGSVIITAQAGGQTGTSAVSVFEPASYVLMTDTATLRLGDALQVSATAYDRFNHQMSGGITYTSSDPNVATVSSTGVVTPVSIGPVTITASSGQVGTQAQLQVSPRAENALGVGEQFTCALTVTGDAYCWGANNGGQLGDGSNTQSLIPVRVAAPPGLRFKAIAAGTSNACAISTQDALYCWGGSSLLVNSPTPVRVSGSLRIASVTLGSNFGCALDFAGAAYCAGANGGMLGNGVTAPSSVLVPVSGGRTFSALKAGLVSTCGLTTVGAAYCWGNNAQRTLGVGASPPNSLVPLAVSGGLTFTSVSVGWATGCGVVATGAAYCWGQPFLGAAGTGTTAFVTLDTPTPVVGGVAFSSVALGPEQLIVDLDWTCGLTGDGTAYCWGGNDNGQLGVGNAALSSCTFNNLTFGCTGAPMAVATSEKFKVIGLGGEQTCGLTLSHKILCWGVNTTGQLGDNTTTSRNVPTLVLGNMRLP